MYTLPESAELILAEWIQSGVVRPPKQTKTPLPASPVRLPEGTASRLLDEDRREGAG